MLTAFTKGLRQLDDRTVRRVLWLGIGAAILALVALWSAVGYALTHFAWFETGWLNTVIDILGGLATLVLTWVLFPVVISTVISLWLEDVAAAVEARHYPALPKARGQSLGQSALIAIRFLAIAVGLNLLILPLIVLPPVFPFVFYSVNGYLLGREYFELVALRRIGFEEARALRKANQGRLFVAGVAVAFLLTVPLVNLLAPLVATAAMVHLFQTWRGGAPHLRRA